MKRGAVSERVIAYRGNACGCARESDACKRLAVVERARKYVAARNGYVCKACRDIIGNCARTVLRCGGTARIVCSSENVTEHIVVMVGRGGLCVAYERKGHSRESAATRERKRADCGYVIGYCNFGNRGAVLEEISPEHERGCAFAEVHVFKACTAAECVVAERGESASVGDIDIHQTRAVLEGVGAYRLNPCGYIQRREARAVTAEEGLRAERKVGHGRVRVVRAEV